MVMVEMIGFDWQTKLTCFGLDLGKHCPHFHINSHHEWLEFSYKKKKNSNSILGTTSFKYYIM